MASTPDRSQSGSEIDVKPLYRAADAPADEPAPPGVFPFTRGVYPTMYRGRLWTMRQYAGFGTAQESKERYRYLLAQGQTGLSVAFDLPTQIGYDSDDPMAAGEVGKVGVSISSIHDMRTLFRDIPLDKVSTSMTINAPAGVLLALYLAVAEEQGVSWDKVSGTIQNDILKEFHAQNEFVYPPEPSVRLVCDVIEFCAQQVPQWNSVSISGYHIREAGSTAVQELAFTLADGFHYVDKCLERGMDIDAVVKRLRGPKGSQVKVKLEREGYAQPLEFIVVRDELPIPSVPYSFMVSKAVGHIRLVDFKLGFGRLWDGDFSRIILADEISPDGCRLWDMKTSHKLDKDRFRQDLGGVEDAYQEVYRRIVQGGKAA